MTRPPQPADHIWWLVSRASGLIALALITLSVTLGLMMASRLLHRPGAAQLRVVHEHLALAALVAIAVHGLALLGDPWLRPGLGGIAVPFVLGYRTVYTGFGVIAGYLTALLALSFYVRRWIGGRTWRRLHRLTTGAYLLAVVHALGAGTDTSVPIVRTALLASAVPILLLLAYRLVASGRASPRGRGSAAASRSPRVAPQDAGS